MDQVENVSGTKRKAESQPPEVGDASEVPTAEANKKLKQEFICKLCQVVSRTEKTYEEHLLGKRHRKAVARREKNVTESASKFLGVEEGN